MIPHFDPTPPVVDTSMATYYLSSGDGRYIFHSDHVNGDGRSHFKPVVVIDPEDREQARNLAWRVEQEIAAIPYDHKDYAAELTAAGQRALRSLLAPPKPPEPAVWAVAVVADNTPFLRVHEDHITPPHDRSWFGEHPKTGERVRMSWTELHDLGDVRVVSGGAT